MHGTDPQVTELRSCAQRPLHIPSVSCRNPPDGSIILAKVGPSILATGKFSRPSVSNDNPFSESLFRTLKYCPEYPSKPFATVEAASSWVSTFVDWYNNHHLHSAICFVTPAQRHTGEDRVILEQRDEVYQEARAKNPERWSGQTWDWSQAEAVRLNPAKNQLANGAA